MDLAICTVEVTSHLANPIQLHASRHPSKQCQPSWSWEGPSSAVSLSCSVLVWPHPGGWTFLCSPPVLTQTNQTPHGWSPCDPVCSHTSTNVLSCKLSSWLWPGDFAWLASSFCFVLILCYLLNQYASNIFCHTKRLAVRNRETEKFLTAVQIYHVLGAHLAL